MKRFLSFLCMIAMTLTAFSGVVLAEETDSLYGLAVNSHTQPVGVELPLDFSWKLQSARTGAKQIAYKLELAGDAAFEQILWSKEEQSGNSNAIAYDGAALQSGTDYWWRVTVTTDENKTLTASSHFLTGLWEETEVPFVKLGTAAATCNYTVETTVYGGVGAASLVFNAIDINNNYMWQLNFSDNATVQFKPHTCIGGKYTALSAYTANVSDAVGGIEGLRKGVQLKVAVTEAGVTTYLDGQKVSEIPASAFGTLKPGLGLVGYRGAGNEFSYYDNLTVMNGEELLLTYDFEEYNPFSQGELQSGKLLLNYTGGVVLPAHGEVYRTEFAAEKEVADAKLFAAALGNYDAWINGTRVGTQELKAGYSESGVRRYYNTFDVTDLIGAENALSAIVTSGWWNGKIVKNAASFSKPNGFWAFLKITYTDGTTETVSTGTDWKVLPFGPVLMGDIYEGEVYDARLGDGWKYAAYDDAGWLSAAESADFTGTLSTSLGVDVYVREDLERSVESGYIYDGVDQVTADQYGVVTKVAELNGDAFTLKAGQTAVIDLGQNFAGREELTVSGKAGTMIKVRHAEMLNEGKGLKSRGNDGPEGSVYQVALRGVEATTRYILSGAKTETYHPTHTFYGFRYLEITATDTVTIHQVKGQVLTSAYEDTGSLVAGDADVNQLLSNIHWGLYSNYLSVPTDCPQRDERAGWTADTQVFAIAGSYLNQSKEFLRTYLQSMRDTQRASDGAYSSVSPTNCFGLNYGAFGWADAGVIVPYELWKQYGDVAVLEEMYPSMQHYIDGFLATSNKTGGHDYYGDWLAYEANDAEIKDILAVAYYAYDALLMSEMAAALGKTEDATRYQALYETEKEYFIEQFVQEDGTLIRSEQSVCLYALYLDLLPDDASRTAVSKQLTDNIRSKGNKLQTGFLGTKIILETLTEIGEVDLAYKLLLQHENPSWLYTVDQGATTMWERWNSYSVEDGFGAANMNSFNHYAYGAVAGWMYRYMAGIIPGEDGYKNFTLQPYPHRSLGSAAAEYESVYGLVKSAWSYEGDTFKYSCTVPANTTATIMIPVADASTLTGGDAEGLTFVEHKNGYAVYTAVAGSYAFTASSPVEETVSVTVKNADESVLSVLTCNGNVTAWGAPVEGKAGEKMTLVARAYNDVDYQMEWYDVTGQKVATGTLEITPTEDATYTVKPVHVALANLAEGKTVTANSTVNADWGAANLTDGVLIHSTTNGWSSASDGKNITTLTTPKTLTVDLGASTTFDQWKLYPRTKDFSVSSRVVCFPVAYTVETSSDNSTWTNIATVTDGTVPDNIYQPALVKLNQAATARYVRFTITKINSYDDYNNSHVQLSELALCNSAVEAVVSDNLALGAGLTVSSNNGGAWDKKFLNDGATLGTTAASGWSTQKLGVGTSATEPATLPTAVTATFDFGAETTFNQWRMYPRNHDLTVARMFPINYIVQVSNDNTNWKTVATITDGDVPAQVTDPAIVTLKEAVTARYVKFTITKINLPDTWKNNLHVQLAELEIYYKEDYQLLQDRLAVLKTLDPAHFASGEQIAPAISGAEAASNEEEWTLWAGKLGTLLETLELKDLQPMSAEYLHYSEHFATSSYWLIEDAADLVALEQYSKTHSLSGFTFTQTADISMQGISGYTGIGSSTSFKGTYDGGFYKISDLAISYNGDYRSGTGFALFAATNGATIKNIRLVSGAVDVTVTADTIDSAGDLGVGGIIGHAVSGTRVENCYNGASVTFAASDSSSKDISVAGIVGRGLGGTCIINCVNAGAVTAAYHAAGINDWGQNGSSMSYIINCVNLGQITATEARAIARYNDLSSSYLYRYQRYSNNYWLAGSAATATNRDSTLAAAETFESAALADGTLIRALYDGSIFYPTGWAVEEGNLYPGKHGIGDLNGNGGLDLSDVILLLQHLVGYEVDVDLSLADLNQDTRVSIFDAVCLLKKTV